MPEHSEHYRIKAEKDLDYLLISGSDMPTKVVICSPKGAEHDLVRLESKINYHLTACGCEAATLAAIAGLGLSFLWFIIRPQGIWPFGFMDIILLASAFVIPATAAKGLVILWHRRQVRRALRELKACYGEAEMTD